MNAGAGIAAAVPVLRILDESAARDFYLAGLGFALDWEHRFAPDMPLYAQVSRAGCLLHLSAHAGDASPGGSCFIPVADAAALHAEWQGRGLPGGGLVLEQLPWGRQVTVLDPFANRLRFCQQTLSPGQAWTFTAGLPGRVQATGPWREIAPYQGR
ncbi:glyoxalase superfamily protein [Cribrihabitans pelagius]|uniref:glyoxalase superfamily protein n=1 Tax=Cribrihabitans pelagius TaxID=1765746 RepID=UPI003B592297